MENKEKKMTKGQALYNFILSLGISEEQLFDFMLTADGGEDIFYELKNEGRQFVTHDCNNDMPVHCAGFEGRIADDGKSCADRVACLECPYKSFWNEEFKEKN